MRDTQRAQGGGGSWGGGDYEKYKLYNRNASDCQPPTRERKL